MTEKTPFNIPALDQQLISDLQNVRDIVIFSGAGMSAESGIPTFRDRMTGLWAQTDPLEIATPMAFRWEAQQVWDWHVHLGNIVRAALPHAGHLAIAALEQRGLGVTVITQNIDNLHQRAGSQNVIELHGNLLKLKPFIDEDTALALGRPPIICSVCNGHALWEKCDPNHGLADLAAIELCAGPVPHCPSCGALLRPDIVWFGEPLNLATIEAALRAIENCDLLIAVGASLEVEPAASLPWRALDKGARVIEINPTPTVLADYCHASIAASAAKVLPELLDLITSESDETNS